MGRHTVAKPQPNDTPVSLVWLEREWSPSCLVQGLRQKKIEKITWYFSLTSLQRKDKAGP